MTRLRIGSRLWKRCQTPLEQLFKKIVKCRLMFLCLLICEIYTTHVTRLYKDKEHDESNSHKWVTKVYLPFLSLLHCYWTSLFRFRLVCVMETRLPTSSFLMPKLSTKQACKGYNELVAVI
ncbi:hypothetical protein MKW92_010604 [Papaver armeniacum]|nr:hypothetical protein MKW92_010604 [Papaver armeniacum]